MTPCLLLGLWISLALPTLPGQVVPQGHAVPVSGDRIFLTVVAPNGAEATITVLNGGLVRITHKSHPTIGLVPKLDGTDVQLTVLAITAQAGGQSVREVGMIRLTAGQPSLVDAAGVTIRITWVETKPPAAAPLQLTGCTICCLTCHDVTICACEVVMDCGQCCCPDGCGCIPDEGRGGPKTAPAKRLAFGREGDRRRFY